MFVRSLSVLVLCMSASSVVAQNQPPLQPHIPRFAHSAEAPVQYPAPREMTQPEPRQMPAYVWRTAFGTGFMMFVSCIGMAWFITGIRYDTPLPRSHKLAMYGIFCVVGLLCGEVFYQAVLAHFGF